MELNMIQHEAKNGARFLAAWILQTNYIHEEKQLFALTLVNQVKPFELEKLINYLSGTEKMKWKYF